VSFVLCSDFRGGQLDVASNHRERAVSKELLESEDVSAAEDEPLSAGVTESMR
jgi:hypothetical protein